MSKVDASIIIRTLNEERYLPQLLEAIQCQNSTYRWEVLLIDSGSTDGTLSIAGLHGCRILHISREEFSFGRSLNLACEAALGKYFVMVSGHCVPCNTSWLQQLVDPLAKGLVQYNYGRQLGGPQSYWSEKQIFARYFPAQSQLPQKGFYTNNANSAILSCTWHQYRFEEELTGLEDMHLAKRLVLDGGKVGYVAEAGVFHYHHESWAQVQRRFEREALALQQICPEVVLRRRDLIRYVTRAILSDFAAGLPGKTTPRGLGQVLRYRLHQYVGSYRGNRLHRQLTAQLRDSYFYPTESKGKAFAPSKTSGHDRQPTAPRTQAQDSGAAANESA